jgi:hypothetical protein
MQSSSSTSAVETDRQTAAERQITRQIRTRIENICYGTFLKSYPNPQFLLTTRVTTAAKREHWATTSQAFWLSQSRWRSDVLEPQFFFRNNLLSGGQQGTIRPLLKPRSIRPMKVLWPMVATSGRGQSFPSGPRSIDVRDRE